MDGSYGEGSSGGYGFDSGIFSRCLPDEGTDITGTGQTRLLSLLASAFAVLVPAWLYQLVDKGAHRAPATTSTLGVVQCADAHLVSTSVAHMHRTAAAGRFARNTPRTHLLLHRRQCQSLLQIRRQLT